MRPEGGYRKRSWRLRPAALWPALAVWYCRLRIEAARIPEFPRLRTRPDIGGRASRRAALPSSRSSSSAQLAVKGFFRVAAALIGAGRDKKIFPFRRRAPECARDSQVKLAVIAAGAGNLRYTRPRSRHRYPR